MTEPRSILVVSLRYLGDVLLTTPLIGSLRAAWPAAAIDTLVLAGAEGALEGNPDVRRAMARSSAAKSSASGASWGATTSSR